MNRFLRVLLVSCCVFSKANAKIFDGNDNISKFSDEYNTIENGVSVNVKFGHTEIVVTQPVVHVNNHGTITGNIDVNGNFLYIQNDGYLNGNISDNSGGGAVKQIISSNDDFKKINVDSGVDFYVDIENMNNLNLTGLKDLNADVYNIKNSDIYMADFTEWQNWDRDIYFEGDNNLHIEHVDTIVSGQVIKNVSDIKKLNLDVQDIDVLHKIVLNNTAYGAVVNIVRETNYKNIFHDKRGDLLEGLRAINKNDKFIKKLDSVQNMRELNSVLNSSYHFNHDILTRPLKVFNNFVLMDDDSDVQNIMFKAGYIGGDKINAYGGFGRIGGFYKNLYLGVGLTANESKYTDKFNNFNLNSYGFNIKSKIDFDDFWVNGIAGFTVAKYKADNIYYQKDIKNNPNGYSKYAAVNVGHSFDLNDGIKIDLFSGINYQNVKVLNADDSDINLRIGSDVKYSYDMIGIKYEYSVGGAVLTNGDLFGFVKIGFWSEADESGASVDFGVINSEYDLNYKAAINLKTVF